MKMANILTSIIVLVLFWGLAVGTRTTKLFSVEDRAAVSASSPSSSDGICASMVVSQGYPCEEHTVHSRLSFFVFSLARAVDRSCLVNTD